MSVSNTVATSDNGALMARMRWAGMRAFSLASPASCTSQLALLSAPPSRKFKLRVRRRRRSSNLIARLSSGKRLINRW